MPVRPMMGAPMMAQPGMQMGIQQQPPMAGGMMQQQPAIIPQQTTQQPAVATQPNTNVQLDPFGAF